MTMRTERYRSPSSSDPSREFLYRKNEQGDLTAAQVRTLARLVREEFR